MSVHRKPLILSAVLLITALLAACGGGETPTLTLPPTWTPTPYVSPTATPLPPTATATPTAPPAEATATDGAPNARLTVTAETAELRSGPGPDFEQVGTLKRAESSWWSVETNRAAGGKF